MLSFLLCIGIGGALGAGMGYFGQCSSGACPLTSTWWRGSLYGATLGLVYFFMTGGSQSAAINQSTKNVVKIGASEFEREVMQAPQPVLVDFFAPWCGPCKTLAPVLDELAGQFAGRIKFVKINVDEAPALAERFEIQGIPTLLLFKNGQVAIRHTGLAAFETLKTKLSSIAP